MKDAAAIVGIGETPFAKALEDSEAKLAGTAILAALEDAGIEASEVDVLDMDEREAVVVGNLDADEWGASDVDEL